MFKLIRKITLVLIPVIAISIALEFVAREIPTTYSTKISNFNKNKNKIEILVMGSSHSNYGINPQFFGRSAYNLSNTSQCLFQDYKLLVKYLPQCKNLKLVIIPISYFSMQTDLAKSSEAWRTAYYSLYMGVQTDTTLSKYDLRNYSALFLWDGPIGVIQGIRNIKQMNINEYGYQTPEKSTKKIDQIINNDAGMNRAAFHDKFMYSSLLNFNISALDGIASELKNRNIKMVFITTPVFNTYQRHISKRNYDIMTTTIGSIAKKYSVQYFNYFYDNRFELSDYSDNDHLNTEGAKKFSFILKEEVIDKLI